MTLVQLLPPEAVGPDTPLPFVCPVLRDSPRFQVRRVRRQRSAFPGACKARATPRSVMWLWC